MNMEVKHDNVIFQEVQGSLLKLYLNIVVDPEAPGYDKAVVEEVLRRAHSVMKHESLTELELEKVITQ